MREKLIELLTDNLPRIGNLPKCDNPLQYTMDEIVERIADHLIANGVTLQKWIPVSERLPEKQKYDWVLVQLELMPEKVYGVPCVAELRDGDWYDADGCWIGTDPEGGCVIVTHWMPLPDPPKGE